MSSVKRICARLVVGACLGGAAGIAPPAPAAQAATRSGSAPVQAAVPSGGVGLAGLLAPNHVPTQPVQPVQPVQASQPIPPVPGPHAAGTWLRDATITEYWPAPESWFSGRLVSAPGLSGKHRIDWLYSAGGVSMQGQGLGLDGLTYHISALGPGGWVTAAGRRTSPANGWAAGAPYWRIGGFWRNPLGAVTYPLAGGGWSAGTGRKYVPLAGVRFAPGASMPLQFLQSIAVDPRVLPIGSQVYIPAYRDDGHGGWFIAEDTGGAITGHHIDVYRSPPESAGDGGRYLSNQRIFVVKPHG